MIQVFFTGIPPYIIICYVNYNTASKKRQAMEGPLRKKEIGLPGGSPMVIYSADSTQVTRISTQERRLTIQWVRMGAQMESVF